MADTNVKVETPEERKAAIDKAVAEGRALAEKEFLAKLEKLEKTKSAEIEQKVKEQLEVATPKVLQVDATELAMVLRTGQTEASNAESLESLGLDHAPNGGIFQLSEDSDLINAWGESVDEEGNLIDRQIRRRR